jgi:hypothetical protein
VVLHDLRSHRSQVAYWPATMDVAIRKGLSMNRRERREFRTARRHQYAALVATLALGMGAWSLVTSGSPRAEDRAVEAVLVSTQLSARPSHAPPPAPEIQCDQQCQRLINWLGGHVDNPPTGCPSGYVCVRGGIKPRRPCALPVYICNREAWLIDVRNPHGTAEGKYQFETRTWRVAARGAGHPRWADTTAGMAPEYIQDAVALWLWDHGRGASHWGG